MEKNTFLLCLLFALLFTSLPSFVTSSAQDAAERKLLLTLDETLELAQSNSHEARISRWSYVNARWEYSLFQSSYLPALALGGNAPGFLRSFDNIVQDNGTLNFIEQRRTFSTFGFTLSQRIPQTGGTLSLYSGLNYLDQQGRFSSTEWQSTPLSVSLTQPLFQYNFMKWQRRLEPLRFELASRFYTQEIAELDVEITDRFFAVYDAQKSIEIASFNVAVNDTIFTLSQGRFDIGRIAENDLLQSELQLINAQTGLSNAQIEYERALRDLKIALDLPLDVDVEVLPPVEIPEIVMDPALAVELARRNRPAFLDLELQELQAQQNVDQARKGQIGINMTASYGLNQNSDEFSNLYVDPLDQQRFNITFDIPLFQWGAQRARVNAALSEQDRIQEERQLLEKQLDQIVFFQVRQLQLLQQQVEAAAQADTIATRRFEVARNRYLVGNIDITELFNAQREKDEANRSYILTLRQFWTSLYRLRQLTLYDITSNEPLPLPAN